jgi:hypothetical protein
MPSYVLKCEGCAGFQPFLVHEDELPQKAKQGSLQRYCRTCRRNTNWGIASVERRGGRDRRTGLDRRGTE